MELKKVLKLCIAAILSALIIFSVYKLKNLFNGTALKTETEISSDALREKLIRLNELVTVEYNYTNAGVFNEDAYIFDVKIPFTNKNFVLKYDGRIKAGVDLNDMTVGVLKDEIKIGLPKSRIISHEIMEDSMEVLNESNNIFNPVKIEDMTKFSAEQKKFSEQRALNVGILKEAEDKAVEAVKTFMELIPVGDYKVTVTVRGENSGN